MGKVLFTIKPHSIVDIITNSSSELFVFKNKTKEIVENLIKNIYPDYKREYDDILSITELSPSELDNFLHYHCYPYHDFHAGDTVYPLIGDYTFDELYEIDPDRRRWDNQYILKDNTRIKKEDKIKKFDDFSKKDIDPYDEENWNDDLIEDERYHIRRFVTENNKEEFIRRVDPNHEMFFMYSIDENPNWEKQELLMNIGHRYHLG